tara:strand:+ start:489 stop:1235 length:747 start_codon:yes stop_codon:yes gene_type:complete
MIILSIICASYNSQKTIEHTIKSVLSQTYKNFELIIIDGKSTDNTVKIIKSFKSQKIKLISEKDTGLYNALNKGLKIAKGKIIGFIGSDDFYPNNYVFDFVIKNFDEHLDSVYGDKQYVNEKDINKVVRYWKAGKYNIKNFYNGWMPPHLSLYIKKNVYDKYGYFNENFICSGDYEYILRVFLKNKISSKYLNKPLITMRTGGISNSGLISRIKVNIEDRKAWKSNNLKPYWYTLILKPISKISQLKI